MTSEIAKFEQFLAAAHARIERAETTDEIQAIITEAKALAAVARVAKDREYEEKAAVVRHEAERKLGMMMAAQRDAGLAATGGDAIRVARGNQDPELKPTLADAGIDKNLAKAARKAYPEGFPPTDRDERREAARDAHDDTK